MDCFLLPMILIFLLCQQEWLWSIAMSTSVCVCVCVCPRRYLRNYTRVLYQIFCACCLWPWLCPSLAGFRNPDEKGQFWGIFFSIVQHCIQKDWTDRDAVWDDEWAWPEEQCCVGWRSPKGRGNFGGKRARQVSHHCLLRIGLVYTAACTWQRKTLDCKRWRSILSAVKGSIAHRGQSLICTIALFSFCELFVNFVSSSQSASLILWFMYFLFICIICVLNL